MTAAKITVATLLFISLVGLAGRVIIKDVHNLMPIKYVRTTGVFQYLSKDEVKTVLEPIVETSIFSADMQAIQQTVAALPWVASVTVKRVWPDAIDIKVHERKPYVRWGLQSLLNERGDLFTPKRVQQFKYLPMLTGPQMQEKKVLEIMKGIRTELADQSLALAEFNVNDRWAWKIKLTTGMEIELGRNEQLKKLHRFLKTLAVLGQERVNSIATVDLRYPNGFAIAWKPESPCCDWKDLANPQNVTNEPSEKALQSKQNGKKNRT
ncbi:MAG: FtsQ-type POTRA domain-containing protein [Methylococcaceae bacterium]|nr:FtsQ-type POTRA domain-containing protein [Methylococcaceae bacterium]